MKNWKRKDSGKSFEETENEIFKDFVGARTESSAYIVKENDDAYKLLLRFLKKPIRIVGDYDVDGQTATAEMILGLRALGATDIDFYAPKRFTDGYGLSTTIVDRFLTGEPGLLVTVDNGIAACDAIKKAKQLGWSVLVIDHHLPVIERGKIILPEADVIIDPHAKAGTANFEDYCAAGLVFKLFQHILTAYNAINTFTFDKIQSLAAIGTVADSVKLIEKIGGNYVYDNWLIVKRGLETLLQNQGRTNGLYCLLRILNLEYKINETNIGYTLAPVMNSVSRLNDDGAKEVIKLLLREDNNFTEMDIIVGEFKALNERRKELTNLATPAIKQEILEHNMQNDFPIVYASKNPNLHPGIVGIVAGKLEEEFQTPVILLAENETEPGVLHGSARSPKQANIKKLMDAAAENIDAEEMGLKYGGHACAAGIAIKAKYLEEYREIIQKNAGEKPDGLDVLLYDYDILPKEAGREVEIIKMRAPYGAGHERPVYRMCFTTQKNATGKYYMVLGTNKNVLKLFGNSVEAINFSGEGLSQFRELGSPNKLILYGTLDENNFNNVTTPQIQFTDMEVWED